MDDSDSSSTQSVASQYASYGAGRESAETSAGYGMGTPVSTYSSSGGRLYDSDGTVYNTDGTQTQDSSITGTPPAAAMSGATFAIPSTAPVVSGAPATGVASAPAKGDLPRALLTLGSFVLGFLGLATPAAPGAALGLGKMFYNGEHTKMMKDFGSTAPTTNVATGTGAAAAASYFSGDAPSSRSGSGGYGFASSPVIGYQGALVNQPNSPALATANLGTSKAAASTLKLTPAGVSTTQQAETPWTAILVTVGLVALLS